MTRSRTRQAPAILLATMALLAALLALAATAAADPSIQSKRAQAQAVLAEIDRSNVELEKTIESYNAATGQLAAIDADLASNTRHLAVAKKSLQTAQTNIAARLRALYVNGDSGGTVEILLGAENLDDLLGRLDVVQRVGSQDAKVLRAVRRFRTEVKQRRAQLQTARTKQASLVAQRASQKQAIQSELDRQQRMLAGIQDEIQRLKAEEARRQAVLAAQARTRLAAAQGAAKAQAAQATADAFTSSLGSSSSATVDPTALADAGIPSPPPARYGGVVGLAMQQLGKPYVWGTAGPDSFDCSGLVMFVYAQVGVSLPHNAAAMFSYGTPVGYNDLQPGDLVFFSGLGHMGIFIGGGQFIHAPHTGDVVKISFMNDHGGYVGARRL